MNSLFSCLLVYWGDLPEKLVFCCGLFDIKYYHYFCLRLVQVNIPIKVAASSTGMPHLPSSSLGYD